VPEPSGRVPGEHQRYPVVDAEPRSDPYQPTAWISMKTSGAERPQKRRPFDRVRMPSQIEIRGAALELVADKERQRDRIAIEAAQ
jgi:hypothetical protein